MTVVKRDRGHLREQAVAVSIARMTYLLFGKLLPSVAATLTSVLLGQQVTPRQVREWWELAAGKSRRRAKQVKR